MSKMIQVRHVPDAVHRKLKSRAATMGLSLSDYLVQELTHVAELPTMDELIERVSHRTPVESHEPTVQSIRRMREKRGRT